MNVVALKTAKENTSAMNQNSPPVPTDDTSPAVKRFGLFLGPILFALTFALAAPEGMSASAWHVCGLSMWMAAWWITEAKPLPVTSLLPVVVLPVFGITTLQQATAPFASSIIFLFLGGFLISLAMEKCSLHMRIGLGVLKMVGVGGKSILAGLMLATGFMGMWMSNTATTIMMLPMAVSIALLLTPEHAKTTRADGRIECPFAKAMVLGVAYSAVIGGLSTFVGTPTNAILAGHLSKAYNYDISLADWMKFGVPLMLVLLALTWTLLNAFFLRGCALTDDVRSTVRESYTKLGRMSPAEKVVSGVFACVALLWIFNGPVEKALGIALDDAVIAIFGALLLFTIPLDRKMENHALTWKDTQKLPWGILIFFGGSLSISAALTETGVTGWLSTQLVALQGAPLIVIVLTITVLLIAVSEMMNNVATVTAFLPILTAVAATMQINPLLILVPATLAASCAFMLPGASAPNAIAYGTGQLKVRDMVKAGFLLDVLSVLAIVGATFTLVMLAFGANGTDVPGWAVIK